MGEGQPLIATGPLVSILPHQISHDSSSVPRSGEEGAVHVKGSRVTSRDIRKVPDMAHEDDICTLRTSACCWLGAVYCWKAPQQVSQAQPVRLVCQGKATQKKEGCVIVGHPDYRAFREVSMFELQWSDCK